jgi:hypothetical protein
VSYGKFFMNLFKWKDEAFDERFIMHRFKSTRLAVLVGVVVILALFTYNAVAHKVIRWDLFAITLAIAVTKVCAMAYYRRTN